MLKSNKIYQILTYSYSTMVPIRNGTYDVLSISTGQSWTLESLPLWPLLIYSDPRVGIVCAQSTSLGDLKKKNLWRHPSLSTVTGSRMRRLRCTPGVALRRRD